MTNKQDKSRDDDELLEAVPLAISSEEELLDWYKTKMSTEFPGKWHDVDEVRTHVMRQLGQTINGGLKGEDYAAFVGKVERLQKDLAKIDPNLRDKVFEAMGIKIERFGDASTPVKTIETLTDGKRIQIPRIGTDELADVFHSLKKHRDVIPADEIRKDVCNMLSQYFTLDLSAKGGDDFYKKVRDVYVRLSDRNPQLVNEVFAAMGFTVKHRMPGNMRSAIASIHHGWSDKTFVIDEKTLKVHEIATVPDVRIATSAIATNIHTKVEQLMPNKDEEAIRTYAEKVRSILQPYLVEKLGDKEQKTIFRDVTEEFNNWSKKISPSLLTRAFFVAGLTLVFEKADDPTTPIVQVVRRTGARYTKDGYLKRPGA